MEKINDKKYKILDDVYKKLAYLDKNFECLFVPLPFYKKLIPISFEEIEDDIPS